MTESSIPERTPILGLQNVWAAATPVEDLRGWWVKRADIPPDGLGVAEDDHGTVHALPNGRPAVGGAWHRITHGSAPRIKTVGVTQTRRLTLHPEVTKLLTADGQLVDADWMLGLEVTDPARFYARWIRPEQGVTVPRLQVVLAAQAHYPLERLTRDYVLQDLLHSPQVAGDVAGRLAQLLSAYLANDGVKVTAVQHLTFRDARDEVERKAKLNALRERLRHEDLRAQMQLIKEQHQLREYAEKLTQEAWEAGVLRQAERDDMIRDLRAEVVEPAAVAETIEKRTADEVAQEEANREAGPLRLMQRLEAGAEAGTAPAEIEPETQADAAREGSLRKWLKFLSYAGTIVFWGTSLVALIWPRIFGDERLPRLIVAASGLLVAILSFASAFWVGNRVRQYRAARLARLQSVRLSTNERARTDQLLRIGASGALRRAVDRTRAAKDGVLRAGDRTLAADLKQMENRLAILAQHTEAMAPALSSPGAGSRDRVAALVDTEEKVLSYAEELADLGIRAHEAAQANQLGTVKDVTPKMESSALELKNLLEDRSRLLSVQA